LNINCRNQTSPFYGSGDSHLTFNGVNLTECIPDTVKGRLEQRAKRNLYLLLFLLFRDVTSISSQRTERTIFRTFPIGSEEVIIIKTANLSPVVPRDVTRVIFTAKLRVRFCREPDAVGRGGEWRIYQARHSVQDRLNEFRKSRSRRRMYHPLLWTVIARTTVLRVTVRDVSCRRFP